MQLPMVTDNGASTDVERIRSEVARGLQYTHQRANANTGKLLEVTAFAYSAIELLAEKGVLSIEELDERKKAVTGRVADRFRDIGMGVVHCEPDADKYAFEGTAEIDCADRLHLCHAACCRLAFALTRQDVEERVIEWEFGRPYLVRQDDDGYCTHLDRGTCSCSVYDQRPIPCRGYDCRGDQRIWADFENYVPSPDLDRLFEQTDGER
jgi:hypothetical protein